MVGAGHGLERDARQAGRERGDLLREAAEREPIGSVLVDALLAADRDQQRRPDPGKLLEDVVALGRAVLVEVGPGRRDQRGRQIGGEQAVRAALVDELLRAIVVGQEGGTVRAVAVGAVGEARRRGRDRSRDPGIALDGQEVDRLNGAEALSPDADVAEAARLGEIEPGRPVVAAVVDALEGGAEPAGLPGLLYARSWPRLFTRSTAQPTWRKKSEIGSKKLWR